MAYETGTASSVTSLKTLIETFCAANGYTVSGGTISHPSSGNYTRLTIPSGTNYTGLYHMKVEQARNSAFTVGVCARPAVFRVPSTDWPFTYHLFALSNPNTIMCVGAYSAGQVSWLGFGDLVKPYNYTGGGWFSAQGSQEMDERHYVGAPEASNFLGCTVDQGSNSFNAFGSANNQAGSAMPFWRDAGAANSFLYAEVAGYTWINSTTSANAYNPMDACRYLQPLMVMQPNVWNSHSVLLPVRPLLSVTGGTLMDLGQVNGLRVLRIDNFNLGDVITIGADKWKVFPAWQKNTTVRNGGTFGSPSLTTGTLGFAVAYDGP